MPRSDPPDPALRPSAVRLPSIRVAGAGAQGAPGRVALLPSIAELACLAGIWLCVIAEYFCETLGSGNLDARGWYPMADRGPPPSDRRRGGAGARAVGAERSRAVRTDNAPASDA